jgi:hypothetical protein
MKYVSNVLRCSHQLCNRDSLNRQKRYAVFSIKDLIDVAKTELDSSLHHIEAC